MNISQDTEQVLSFLDETTDGNLRKRSDLGAILEIGADSGNAELINKIIFYGKYHWSLYQKIKRTEAGKPGEQNLKNQAAGQVHLF